MWLRDLFIKDFWLKLFSLAVAVLVWLTVSLAIKQESAGGARTFSRLPVRVVSSAADVHEFKTQPEHVDVEVRAAPNILSKLTENDIQATVNLTNVESASGLLMRVEVATPAGVTFVRVIPSHVEIIPPQKPLTAIPNP